MGWVKLSAGVVLTGLFAVALITFAVEFASDNSTNYTIDSSTQNVANSNIGNLTIWVEDVEDEYESFAKSQIQTGETFKTGGQFKGGSVSSANQVKSILKDAYVKIFGPSSESKFYIFLNSLFAFLTFMFIVYIYKTWMGRNPD